MKSIKYTIYPHNSFLGAIYETLFIIGLDEEIKEGQVKINYKRNEKGNYINIFIDYPEELGNKIAYILFLIKRFERDNKEYINKLLESLKNIIEFDL